MMFFEILQIIYLLLFSPNSKFPPNSQTLISLTSSSSPWQRLRSTNTTDPITAVGSQYSSRRTKCFSLFSGPSHLPWSSCASATPSVGSWRSAAEAPDPSAPAGGLQSERLRRGGRWRDVKYGGCSRGQFRKLKRGAVVSLMLRLGFGSRRCSI